MPVIHEVNRPKYFSFAKNNYDGLHPEEAFISKCLRVGSMGKSNGMHHNGNGGHRASSSSSSTSGAYDNCSDEDTNPFPSLNSLAENLPVVPSTSATLQTNEIKLVELMNRTGYNIVQRNGQRIYGGPPPGWTGPPPCKGTEVFVGKVPRDMYEWELVPIFERCGKIYELRLMMDFSGSNRGYLFIRYTKREEAKRAINEMNNFEIRPRQCIGVIPSVDNRKLWISGIPKNRSADEIKDAMSKMTDGVISVYVYNSHLDKSKSRGYAFVEYETHRAAALARRKLVPGRIFLFDQELERVDWAEPENDVDDEIMATVQILFIRNLSVETTESEISSIFEEVSNGQVDRVKKTKDYAFVHFNTREAAELAYEAVKDNLVIDNCNIEVSWSKPIDRHIHSQRKQLTKALTTGSSITEAVPPIPVANFPFTAARGGMIAPRPRGAAGIRGLGAPGTPPPRNLIRKLNATSFGINPAFLHEYYDLSGMKFPNPGLPPTNFGGLIPNGPPSSPPPTNGSGNFFNGNMRMVPPPVMQYSQSPIFYYGNF